VGFIFFFQAEDGIRDFHVTGVQTCALPIYHLIDQPIIRSENVTVTSASGIHATTMAEYAFMMMLALGHRLLTAIRLQSEAEWARSEERRVGKECRSGWWSGRGTRRS